MSARNLKIKLIMQKIKWNSVHYFVASNGDKKNAGSSVSSMQNASFKYIRTIQPRFILLSIHNPFKLWNLRIWYNNMIFLYKHKEHKIFLLKKNKYLFSTCYTSSSTTRPLRLRFYIRQNIDESSGFTNHWSLWTKQTTILFHCSYMYWIIKI